MNEIKEVGGIVCLWRSGKNKGGVMGGAAGGGGQGERGGGDGGMKVEKVFGKIRMEHWRDTSAHDCITGEETQCN